MKQWKELSPEAFARSRQMQETAYSYFLQQRYVPSNLSSRSNCQVYRIPVVVHVFYNDGASNISEEQIRSQIAVLNQDFRRLPGSPGFGEGADTRIEFCLATIAPDGSATNGITRTGSTFTNHKSNEESLLKNQMNWDDTRYLNIWVVKSITWTDPNNPGQNEEILGYASFPGSPVNVAQGIVISGKFFGTTGTAKAPYNMGRTCTHEVGHYLGLLHPFEDDSICRGSGSGDCNLDGDFVCDTPAEQYPTFGCPDKEVNTCDDRPCDVPDPLSNYMNFTDDVCMDHFTEGQRLRMEFFLNSSSRSGLHSAANLLATGCNLLQDLKSPPKADFSSSAVSACAGSKIAFADQSSGCVEAQNWLFEGGIPQSATGSDPLVSYIQPGSYRVRLIVSNGGGSDTLARENWVHISGPAVSPPLAESFEGLGFVPPGWKLRDEDQKGSWVRTQLAAFEGQSSVAALHFGPFSCNSYEDLISSPVNLSQASSARLFFSYAYQAPNDDPLDADRLTVGISTDCGGSYQPVFDASGTNLATIAARQNDFPFIPQSLSDWKVVALDLNDYIGEPQVQLRFRTLGLNGQNLFLDNILLDASVGVDPRMAGLSYAYVFPNPFRDQLQIQLGLMKTTKVDIEIRDLSGKLIWNESHPPLFAGDHQLFLNSENLHMLPAGLYILRIKTREGYLDRKLIKE